jgi:GTPase SAR1 family protein
LVYDITAPKTFEDVISYWVKETKQYSPEDRIYCFINKCDSGEDTPLPEEQAKFLEDNHIQWFKVSAKTKYGVSEAILHMAR